MLNTVYVVVALTLQGILIIYFALRRWRAPFAFQISRGIYALGVPVVVYSVVMMFFGQPWHVLAGGLLFALWSMLGNKVDTGRPLQWYEPICETPFNMYVLLFLAYQLFFWLPLGSIWRPGSYFFAALFILAAYLNVTSRKAQENVPAPSH